MKWVLKATLNTEDKVKTNYGNLENVDLKITSNNTLLPDSYSAKDLNLEKIASMIKFDIIQSSLPAELAVTTIDQKFLTSMANWEHERIRNICAKILEVGRICQIINERFGFNARSWQVSVLKKDVSTIASTNIGKSLVYQAILIVTRDFVLVILPTIALIEDQVRASLKYCPYILVFNIFSMT